MRCRITVIRLLMFSLFVLLASAAQALPPIGNACDSNPCENGGTCQDLGSFTYVCHCTPSWTGTNCEIPIDFCASNPCVHGDCIDGPTSYVCLCFPGFTGTNCDVPSGPNCSQAVASPNLLWPPNHKFVSINISGVTNQGGGPITISVTSIFQDEPTGGQQDGIGVGTPTPSVRAERDGGGDGRVYHIAFTATNSGGGTCTGTVTVGVPHDQGHKGGPVDQGPLYDSTQP